MTANAIGAPDDRSYPKTREISTSKSDGKLGSRLVQPPDWKDTVYNLRKALAVNPERSLTLRGSKFDYGRIERNR